MRRFWRLVEEPMDTPAVAREASQEDSSARWPSEIYDPIIRDALGDRILDGREPLAGHLSAADLLRAYAAARVSRTMDVRERTLQAQGRAWFSIAGAGKE